MIDTKRKAQVFATAMLLFCMAGRIGAEIRDAFQGILPVTDPAVQKSLNGEWSLKVVEGITDDTSVPATDGSWGRIPVPGCWEAYGFCKPTYDRPDSLTGYYRTYFTVPKEWTEKGNRVVLRLDGVLYGYDLWINGKAAGSWRSAYNTALYDVTPYLNAKAEMQELSMRVVSRFKGSDFDCNDDWTPNGIFRDVTLFCIPPTYLKDITIRARLTGEVDVRTEVENGGKGVSVRHEILDAQGRLVGERYVESPKLWTAETPYLYTLRTTLSIKGKTLQTFEHKFGFRELTIEGNVLKLNGQPIKLRGVTCHSTDPKTVKVIDEELTLRDMKLMKEASVNYIRTSHYPREPRFFELADSLGFYVICEVPFGYGDKLLYDKSNYEILKQRAQATIRRDKNHASVLIWSLGNENPLTDICKRLGEYVKDTLDNSRPICYPEVGSYFRKFNYDFPAIADIYSPHYPTTDQIASFYQQSDRPVIFTEYCHTLGISFEDHDRQWEIIEQTPCIAGGSVWEWVDQGMPFKDYSQKYQDGFYGYEERVYTSPTEGFEMCGNKGTDGLLYANRIPLPNYYELQHNYAQAAIADSILSTHTPILELNIRNRYDFIDLKDNITFHWAYTQDRDTVAQGAFSPDCKPHETCHYELTLPTLPDSGKINLLQVEVSDSKGRTINRQSIPVNPTGIVKRMLKGLSTVTADPMAQVQGEVLLRAGRKATLAETLKVGDKRLERYLLPLPAMETDIKTMQEGNATHYAFTITPDTTDTFLSELGLAFLLRKEIDRVQWIGNGSMPTYPGRFRSGRYGFWAMQQGDLYFEGNRRGVDAAMLTDTEGNGLLIFCNNGNISFEQTDRGIVLTYNVAVAGEGPKFARTAFPVVAKDLGTVSGDFYLYNVDRTQMPALLKTLFLCPQNIPAAFHPFETQYDTYLMRYSDIIQEK